MFALISDGLVHELFAEDPCFNPGLEVVDASAAPTVAVGWAYAGGKFSAPSPPAPTQAQLQAAVISAASSVCAQITNAVAPDAAHANAYQIAAGALSNGVVPSSGPVASWLASYAAANGQSEAQVVGAVLAGASAALGLSSALATLEAEASAATTSAQLVTALTAFEASIASILAAMASGGVTVAAPAAISIAGVNA